MLPSLSPLLSFDFGEIIYIHNNKRITLKEYSAIVNGSPTALYRRDSTTYMIHVDSDLFINRNAFLLKILFSQEEFHEYDGVGWKVSIDSF